MRAETPTLAVLAVAAALVVLIQLLAGFGSQPIQLPDSEGPGLPGEPAAPGVDPPSGPPNVLIILTDDQRVDSVEPYMPRTQALIFEQGVTFSKAYVTTPLCCPSRASILTGQLAGHHGVILNPYALEGPTFFQDLQQAGYTTGLVGKYLNSHDGTPRPGFDTWIAFAGGVSPSFDPMLNVDGTWVNERGHITHILREHAVDFLGGALSDEAPFALFFAPSAPHGSVDPPHGDETLFSHLPPYRPPNFNEQDVSDKPAWLQAIDPLTQEQQQVIDLDRKRALATLPSLDWAVGSLLSVLNERGVLDHTVVIFLSDHGSFWGEHRLTAKNRVYEEAVHIPMAIRYPPLIPQARTEDRLVANIDVAPTVYEITGVEPTLPTMDGRSLVPLFSGEAEDWRTELLLEGWHLRREVYKAVHTGELLYVENRGDRNELYDLIEDPYQLENRIQDPDYQDERADLRDRLARLEAGLTPHRNARAAS